MSEETTPVPATSPPAPTNPMRAIRVAKVTVNMGVGESGKKLATAETLLQTLAGQKPVRTIARKTVFKARRGEPIGCMVTLRKARAQDFLTRALKAVENRLRPTSFDRVGNFSFGVEDHTDFGIKYDPDVGIYGMDVAVSLERPGYRVARRKRARARIHPHHRITPDEAREFMVRKYGVNYEE